MRGFPAIIGFMIGIVGITGGMNTPSGKVSSLESVPLQSGNGTTFEAYDVISREVRDQMEALEPAERLTVIVTLTGSATMDSSTLSIKPMTATSRIRQMQAHANRSQASIMQFLGEMETAGLVHEITPFWIFNGVAITAPPKVIQELGNRKDVAKIEPNRVFYAPSAPIDQARTLSNLDSIHALALWEMGFRGQNVVVANMDTGVLGEHPDLASTWRGGTNSWYDTTGQYPDYPYDTDGHGTWTMGVMVGGDSLGQTLGVAPEAEWIAVRIFDDDGMATSVRIHQGFQWLLDPDGDPDTNDAPQIVNSSWAFQTAGCFLDFQADIQAIRAAGILPIFAAGNAGPGRGTGLSPSNNPGAFSVGAVDSNDLISTTSSRGPSTCGQNEQVFPSLVSPGIGILTTGLSNGYTYSSGTSLAAPHVSGALALLLSAYPDLSVEAQERILLESALDLGVKGPDNDYGNGRLDVLNAYRLLAGQPVPPAQPSTLGSFIYLPHIGHIPTRLPQFSELE